MHGYNACLYGIRVVSLELEDEPTNFDLGVAELGDIFYSLYLLNLALVLLNRW
jgi:hypothetical protein